MKFFALLMAMLSLPFQGAFAFNILLKSGSVKKAPTDVYLVGHGPEMGSLFLHAAVANARKMAELHPERSQLILWAKNQGKDTDRWIAGQTGFKILESNNKKLSLDDVLEKMMSVESISSFHYFGHSNAFSGAAFQAQSGWFSENKSGVAELKKKFTKDAFAILHGCNSGFITAPNLSKLWSIPVFGSLTSTDFVKLHTNGDWYNNNDGNFPEGDWAKVNDVSYEEAKDCTKMSCVRMKPDAKPYTGDFGNYRVGLSFYKAFCANKEKETCLSGILSGVLSFPSSHLVTDRESFKEHVIEILCPGNVNAQRKDNCHKALKENDPSLKIFAGKQLICSLQSCVISVINEGGLLSSKKIFDGPDAGNKTLFDEYNLYLEAFDNI
ncbi:MAG: hypothetical protein Fur0010_26980 [Bdellovibrio sp.]